MNNSKFSFELSNPYDLNKVTAVMFDEPTEFKPDVSEDDKERFSECIKSLNSLSWSFDAPTMSFEKFYKALAKNRYPTKPDNLKYPNKHRKWRIQKKWFNRYQKEWMTRKVSVEWIENDLGVLQPIHKEISDVKLRKGGGKLRNYEIIAK